MTKRLTERFEQELAKLAAGLEKPRSNKNRDKLLRNIGRLKEKDQGIGQQFIFLRNSRHLLYQLLAFKKVFRNFFGFVNRLNGLKQLRIGLVL